MKNIVKSYMRDNRGQFAIMFAVSSAALLMGMVVAVDYTNLISSRAKIRSIADAAALAGATAADLSEAERKKVVNDFITANGHNFLPATIKGDPIIVFDDTNEEVTVVINTEVDLFFGAVAGAGNAPVSAGSISSYLEKDLDPITIAFALDVSGSMGNPTSDGRIKIEALKDSIVDMFTAIEDAVDEPGLLETALRTGMTTYNTAMVDDENMDWGWDHLKTASQTMIAYGGTNAVPALSNAYKQIRDDRVFRVNHDPEFKLSELRESVIFMTDGDNNQPNWDNESVDLCQDMRADGIDIYSVAFAAPDKGQVMLLDCASWDDKNKDKGSNNPNGNTNSIGCLTATQNAQNQNANPNNNGIGPCKDRGGKEGHYFDAEDAAAFRQAFKDIGTAILNQDIRIKSRSDAT